MKLIHEIFGGLSLCGMIYGVTIGTVSAVCFWGVMVIGVQMGLQEMRTIERSRTARAEAGQS